MNALSRFLERCRFFFTRTVSPHAAVSFQAEDEEEEDSADEGAFFHFPRTPPSLRRNHVAHLSYGSAEILDGYEAICPAPLLVMPDACFRELSYYFRRMPQEMQVMGFVAHDKRRNMFTVTELAIPPHTAGTAHAELDQDAYPAWILALHEAGKDVSVMRLQAHSHGFIDSYFSETDIATIRHAYSCDWMISVVGNCAGVFRARLDVFEPIAMSIMLPIVVTAPRLRFSKEELLQWGEQIEPFLSSGIGEKPVQDQEEENSPETPGGHHAEHV